MALEALWAGWRRDYVAAATAAERCGAPGECVFCALAASGPPSPDTLVVWRGRRTLAALNLYPYATGHLLVLPVRHEAHLRGLDEEETAEIWSAALGTVAALERAYSPDGVNMGANLGRAAGAGIPGHVHLHVLPRWSGDTNFMTAVAGVRVMPEPLATSWARLHEAWPDGESAQG